MFGIYSRIQLASLKQAGSGVGGASGITMHKPGRQYLNSDCVASDATEIVNFYVETPIYESFIAKIT